MACCIAAALHMDRCKSHHVVVEVRDFTRQRWKYIYTEMNQEVQKGRMALHAIYRNNEEIIVRKKLAKLCAGLSGTAQLLRMYISRFFLFHTKCHLKRLLI